MKKIKLILIIGTIILLSGCTSNYEGMTAEEWADEYYALHNCTYSAYLDLESPQAAQDIINARDNLSSCF